MTQLKILFEHSTHSMTPMHYDRQATLSQVRAPVRAGHFDFFMIIFALRSNTSFSRISLAAKVCSLLLAIRLYSCKPPASSIFCSPNPWSPLILALRRSIVAGASKFVNHSDNPNPKLTDSKRCIDPGSASKYSPIDDSPNSVIGHPIAAVIAAVCAT